MNFEDFSGDLNEVTYAQGRLTSRTYVSRSFPMQWGQDIGFPARYVYRVFDEYNVEENQDWQWDTEVVHVTPGGRKQLQMQVARESGQVRKIRIQRLPTSGDRTRLDTILELDREQSAALLSCIKALDHIPVEGDTSVHIDDQLLRDILADPGAISSVYSRDPQRFRELIAADTSAKDVVGLSQRRAVVETMRTWLQDDNAFEAESTRAGGPEKAWQGLLEENPWILGIGVGGQLFTAWSEHRLEQVVRGFSLAETGKRVDALLRSQGVIGSLALAEIKHHKTSLLGREYRSGCWPPSLELSGALVQIQQTTYAAVSELGEFIADVDDDGALLTTGTFVLRPRSFLLIGSQNEFVGPSGGVIPAKYRSFEMFRRNIYEPEILTFDELLARAEWHVEMVGSHEEPQNGTDVASS